MHIVFVCYATYAGCSGVHEHFLATAMTNMGHQCTVCVPSLPPIKEYFGSVNYTLVNFNSALKMAKQGYFHQAVLHGWTPRTPTQWLIERLIRIQNFPFFLHLEDNEWLLLEKEYGKPLPELKEDAKIHPQKYGESPLCHPLLFESFLARATGVTCLIKKLEEDVPDGMPRMTFWPACEKNFFQIPVEANRKLQQECGIEPGTTVIVYPGTVHKWNQDDIRDLVLALDILDKQGRKVKLIRSGYDDVLFDEPVRSAYLRLASGFGEVPAKDIPALIQLADILVQPGHPNRYNDYRFPSKIPFFLASGRPVLIPRTNIGTELTHGYNALLLDTGNPEEIARLIALLIDHPELARSIGEKGRLFARKNFSWEKSAQALIEFYKQCLTGSSLGAKKEHNSI